jgi:type II secretory pathway predicted ATPase ExeA
MLSDVRNYYGLARDFGQAGYFETEHSEQIVSELKLEIKAGKLVALSGIVGCGKTTMLRRIQEALSQDKEILASKSLSLEKSQISLATLIMALFYDLGVVSPNRRKFRQAGFQAFTGEGGRFSEIPIRRYSDRMKSVSLVRNPFILGGNAGKERKT